MNKFLPHLLVLSFLALLFVACGEEEGRPEAELEIESPMAHYSDPDARFEFDYPKDWELIEEDGELYFQTGSSDDESGMISIYSMKPEEAVELYETIKEKAPELIPADFGDEPSITQQIMIGISNWTQAELTIVDPNVYRISDETVSSSIENNKTLFQSESSEGTLSLVEYILVTESEVFVIDFIADEKSYEEDKQDVDLMFLSFLQSLTQ